MKEKPLHTHSMLPRTYHQDDNYPESFFHTLLDEDLLTQPKTNIREIEHTYFLEVALPGFNNKDIQVYMNDHKLFIRALTGQRKRDEHPFLRKEFNRGIQTRTFLLPPDIDPHRMISRYENGMLIITLFKVGNSLCLN